ncbi:hypothetical protein F4802DRAFT_592153 [Xylaria palmicola]|nr:hypothetical protein F4802DRAFT_592153 [Xylaria palmicola]
MNIISWLAGVDTGAPSNADPPQPPETRKRRRQQKQQMPTPTASTTNSPGAELPPTKRQRPNDNNEGNVDLDRTPRARGGKPLSISDTSSCSSTNSRISPTKRLAKLELAPDSPISTQQIIRTDHRIPAELKTILRDLDSFQNRNGIVPEYLAAEIQTCAEYNDDFYNFAPYTFERNNGATHLPISDPQLSLHQILKVFKSATECLNEDHAEATWNTLVHWPVFELALGSIADVSERAQSASALGHGTETAQPASVPGERTEDQGREDQVHVCGMPCAAARLTGHARGSKMVDYCIFIEPGPNEAAKINELRERWEYINHTDYNPLRRRPIVLSAESKKPGEGFKNAQLQLSVWQAAQWKFLLDLLAGESEGTQVPAAIPFLPALIIQGHDWYFAASTRFNNETILWIKQPIGATESILGIFQIIHALRHIAAWIRTTYWPWYKRAVLHLPIGKVSGNTI